MKVKIIRNSNRPAPLKPSGPGRPFHVETYTAAFVAGCVWTALILIMLWVFGAHWHELLCGK